METINKIVDKTTAIQQIREWQKESQQVVFSNGCFDILHLGHVDYLEKARNLGDKLVLGLNTDTSVKRLKGPERPWVSENARARVMAALSFVDLVVFFEEDTPLRLIEQLLPNILVKGNDYLADNIVGADIVRSKGGKVETIPLVEGYSTTSLVERIKKRK